MKYNPLDGDRAAIKHNNRVERNASEKRWDAYYKGRQDAREGRNFNNIYVDIDERKMYAQGWLNIKKNMRVTESRTKVS